MIVKYHRKLLRQGEGSIVCRVARRLDADEREIYPLDCIALTRDHIRRAIEIVGGMNRIADCLPRTIKWRAANDPRSRRGATRL
jgi:hypothetical protein